MKAGGKNVPDCVKHCLEIKKCLNLYLAVDEPGPKKRTDQGMLGKPNWPEKGLPEQPSTTKPTTLDGKAKETRDIRTQY